tara:strand:- start:73 stop:636 length:564 start_codon:yes stop_codon:yes gene_type:complete
MVNTELIDKLLLEGKSYREIRFIIPCSNSTISYRAKKLQLNKSKVPKPNYDWVTINNYYHSDKFIIVKDCMVKFGFASQTWSNAIARGDVLKKVRYKYEDIFCKNSEYKNNSSLKKRIIELNLLKYECIICKNNGIWLEKPITLQIDHINGINNDNRIENLRFLCPNCHTQTETYGSKNLVNKNILK